MWDCSGFLQIGSHIDFKISDFCLTASQPDVRPTSARCTAPEILHNKGNHDGFTKLLFK